MKHIRTTESAVSFIKHSPYQIRFKTVCRHTCIPFQGIFMSSIFYGNIAFYKIDIAPEKLWQPGPLKGQDLCPNKSVCWNYLS